MNRRWPVRTVGKYILSYILTRCFYVLTKSLLSGRRDKTQSYIVVVGLSLVAGIQLLKKEGIKIGPDDREYLTDRCATSVLPASDFPFICSPRVELII